MKRCSVYSIVMLAMFAVTACTKEKPAATNAPVAAAPAAPAAAPAADGQLAKIPILPGYKYYVGGPVMKQDAYGRFRLSGFNGEVQQPPSRGMVFGAKLEGDQLEYKAWGNGILIGLHRGPMRDGLFWQTYGETYRQGKANFRETAVHDDATKRSKVITEDLDPENGEVIRTKELSISYLPPADPEGESDDDEHEGDDKKADAAPAPDAKAAAPAEAPKDAAK